ncbi:MAG: NAD-dependent isocitrate dehydrogenase [Thermoprotei archaeon]|nr:MAG: NAD-dependent isocitrate dehydrogenase [Thermoprotei archaeon]
MKRVTLIPGDGIGPEIVNATLKVLDAIEVDIDWEVVNAGRKAYEEEGNPLPEDVIESIRRNKVALKGPLETPIGSGYRSVNVTLRRIFDLYAIIRPAKYIPGLPTRYTDIDLILIREGIEGLYIGAECSLDPYKHHSISIRYMSRDNCKRLISFAFRYAIAHNRKKITLAHKANILKETCGMLREEFLKEARKQDRILAEDMLIDSVVAELISRPSKFDVIVTSNMFGDILSGVIAGLIGTVGILPSANIGNEYAIFETAHGTAPDIAGKGIANPSAMILASAMLLEHIGLTEKANIIREAVKEVIKEGKYVTLDIASKLGTTPVSTSKMAERIAEIARQKLEES